MTISIINANPQAIIDKLPDPELTIVKAANDVIKPILLPNIFDQKKK